MTELKTLKEIPSVLTDDIVAIDRVTVRQEAIKWIKEIRNLVHYNLTGKGKENCCLSLDTLNETGKEIDGTDWIKNFFNITEEDLK